jgi:hypothetical protein
MNDRIYLNSPITSNQGVELRAFVVPTMGAEFGIEQHTPTGWLLVREYFLAHLIEDGVDDLMLDLGQNWVVHGLRAATEEAQGIVDRRRAASELPWYTITVYAHDNAQTFVCTLQAPKLSAAEQIAIENATDAIAEAEGLSPEEAEELSLAVLSYVRTAEEPTNMGAY